MKKSNFKVQFISLSLSVALCFGLIFTLCGFSQTAYAQTTDPEVENDNAETANFETVVSYEDIFRGYYRQTTEAMAEYNIEMPYSFEEFCDGYYMLGMDIQSYCDFLVAEANGTICMADYEISPRSSSGDADYIIKGGTSDPDSSNFDPEITPSSALQRPIYYNNDNFDYSEIREGDIIIETDTPYNDSGHSAFVYDTNKSVSGNIQGRSTYIQVIEAVTGGVQFGFLDDERMVDYGVVILRPRYANAAIIEDAKYFHWSQLGKPYDLPLTVGRVNTSINSGSWYCSELNYAGYYYAGLSIASPSSGGWIWPVDLLTSSSVKYVSFSDTLDARLYGKEDGKWRIRVYNYTGSTVNMYYNAKLAYEDDAKNWTGLKDVNTTPVTIYNNSYADIYISTNWFATTAAISYTQGGKRYVTYCNGLNDATLRMRVYKNVIG